MERLGGRADLMRMVRCDQESRSCHGGLPLPSWPKKLANDLS